MGQIKIPRITTTQRTGGSGLTLAAGELVYDTDTGYIYKGDGSTAGGVQVDGTGTATNVTVADESSDTSCFPLFATAATGDLPPKSGTNLTFNSSSGLLTATLLAGDLTGDVTGNADTVTTNANLTGEVTSSGNATTIAGNVVDEANLKVSNAPTNGYFLSAQSGDTGGLTWAASSGSTNLSATANGTSLTVESSSGSNVALPAADTDNWGVMTDEMFDAIAANTAKATNVSTNLSATANGTSLTVESSDGSNVALPAADTDNWGVMTDEMFDAIAANTAKNTNVVGNLSATANGTSLTVETSNGSNVALPAADTDNWGVMTDEMFDAIAANTAKATNVATNLTASTHASQITINSSDGDNVVIAEASGSIAGVMTVAHHDKLDGIEASATADQTKSDIDGLAITTVGTIDTGTWQGTAVASAYLDADTAHLSGTQTFSGAKTFSELIAPTKGHLYAKGSATHFEAQGDIVKIGTGSTTAGELCYLKADGTWAATDADAVATSGGVLLAMALGTDPDADGMLLRGMFTLDHDPGTIADELYISTTAGDITSTAPSGTGDIVRVVGYCLDSSDGQIWFNPSNDFIVLA